MPVYFETHMCSIPYVSQRWLMNIDLGDQLRLLATPFGVSVATWYVASGISQVGLQQIPVSF